MRLSAVLQEGRKASESGQAVIVYLRLSDADTGDPIEDDDPIDRLQAEVEEAVERSGTGEFDGDEWGGGYCRIFLYGADADQLFEAVLPALLKFNARAGSYAVRRYGMPGSREELVLLGSRPLHH